MKKNNIFKQLQKGWLALLILFCGLFANTAMAQKVQTWTAATDTDWNTATNWSQTGVTMNPTSTTAINTAIVTVASTAGLTTGDTVIGTGVPANTTITVDSGTQFTMSANATAAIGTGVNLTLIFTTPITGAVPLAADVAVLNSTLISPPVISGTITVRRFDISNTFGSVAGPTFTVPLGTTFNCNSGTTNFITVAGGNIVNNGTLGMTNLTMTVAGLGINFITPIQLPSEPIEYGYSGSGLLKMNTPAITASNSAVIANSSANANTTIKLLFNGTTDFTLGATASAVVRNAGTSPLIIGGAGYTHGTVESPKNGGLISLATGSTLTVNPETTLTLNSANTNLSPGVAVFLYQSMTSINFTNKGNINIFGSSQRSGISIGIDATGLATPANAIVNFENQNKIDVNLASILTNQAALAVTVNGTNQGTVNILNTATGVMDIKNNQPFGTNTGSAFRITLGGSVPNVNFTNNGSLNLRGTNINYGGQVRSIITNNGTITSNFEFQLFALTNSATGSISFVNPTIVTTKGVTLTVPQAVTAFTAGATYSNSGNTYTIINTKVAGTGTQLIATIPLSVTPAGTGSLVKETGTGTTPIAWSALASTSLVSSQANALGLTMTNNGTVNTGTGSTLVNVVSGISNASTGTIAPGGTGYGIAELNKATATPDGTLRIQVAGNTGAGVDYDQLRNSLAASTLSLDNLDLDISFLYTPSGNVSIPIVTGIAISTDFASVNGLTPGWALVRTATAVNLEYTTGSATATTWDGSESTSWTDAGNWSNGVPNASSNVTIAAAGNQPVIGSNVSILSLTIDPSASVTVNTGFNLSVIDAITNNGTLTIQNNANLIQVNDVANTGNATVNRNSNALSRLDFTLWSSPVSGSQTLAGFSPLTSQDPSRFYNYSESANAYTFIASPTTATFASAQGYLIRMPNNAVTAPATQTFAAAFTGVPNNGTITKAVAYSGASNGYNAIGNPYPSTIDAASFIAANTAVIESSLYFWRKVNAASGSSYAIYNPMGSTTATPSSAVPNGTIQVGQGFIVKAKSASNVNFTNAMRTTNIDNQFFKTKAAQKDRLWLNLTNAAGAFSQALIGYTADATSGVDMYDAKYINDSPIALTSSINNEEYSIQGRPAFDATDVVALNFKTDVAGDYTLALDHFDGVFATGQDVYLVDSKTGAETNLKDGGYTFTATVGEDNTRFSLKYQKTLKVIDAALDNNSVSVYLNEGAIYINSRSAAINSVKVFDVQGRLLTEQRNVNANTAVISNLRAKNQILIVNVVGEDNSEVSKKIMN